MITRKIKTYFFTERILNTDGTTSDIPNTLTEKEYKKKQKIGFVAVTPITEKELMYKMPVSQFIALAKSQEVLTNGK